MDKTICELFAGVGGFRVGFESISKEFKTVWANQWEPGKTNQYAYECYKSHFEKNGGINEYSNVDISKVKTENIPNHSLLVGGFPCQDYSVARSGAEGLKGKKGVLWWEIERIVKNKKPPFILLENVDRLLKSPSTQRGRDFGIMLAALNNLGYIVEWRVINAADYGFQQRRRRIFIFAYNNKTNFFKKSDYHPREIIFNKGFFSKVFSVYENDLLLESKKLKKSLVDLTNNFSFNFENSGYMKNGLIYTCKTTPSKKIKNPSILLKDLIEKDVDKNFYIKDDDLEKWKYMKGAKAIDRISKKTGHKYTFREGAVPFPDPIDRPARTMLTSERSKNRSTHIILDPQTNRLRKLTPIECERINGFPDNWTNTGMTESFRYFCMGNALVVDLIREMAKEIEKIIENEN